MREKKVFRLNICILWLLHDQLVHVLHFITLFFIHLNPYFTKKFLVMKSAFEGDQVEAQQ